MVRLKALLKWLFVRQFHYFNSNMVRLKAYGEIWMRSMDTPFQFQYGSIKSEQGWTMMVNDTAFQFQYGSIKR